MKKTTLYIIFFVALITCKVNAQVSSVVVDKTNNYPLKNATVELQNIIDTLNPKHGNVKENGLFIFNNIPDGDYQLSISYIGFNNYYGNVVVKHNIVNLPDTIKLEPTDKNLQGVIISSKKTFIEFKADKIIINVLENPIAAGGNAYDVIKRAPGIIEKSNALSFRGKIILVQINDRPTYLSGEELKNLLTGTPASDIEKIEILPNPSAKYDAQAGSVINIKLIKNKGYGLNGIYTAGVGMGSYFRYNTGVNLNYRCNKLNVYGGYNYERNQTYINTNTDREINPLSHILENSHDVRTRNNNTYKLGADYDINKKNVIGFLFNGYLNDRNMTVGLNTITTNVAPLMDSFSNVATIGHARYFRPSANIYYKKNFDTLGKTLAINADYLNYKKIWNDDISTSYYDAHNIPYLAPYMLRDNAPSNNNVYNIMADYVSPIKNGEITAGLKMGYTITDNNILWQYKSDNKWLVDTAFTNHFKYTENINAAYFNYDKTIKKIELTLGIRVEQTNTQGNSLTLGNVRKNSYLGLFPNFSIQYTKNDNHVFAINYRKSVQRPEFEWINPFIIYASQYSYIVGNPNLKPEYDHDITLSYTYKQALNLSLDYTHATNAITPLILNGSNNSIGTSMGNMNKQNQFSLSTNWSHKIKNFCDINLSNIIFYNNYTQLYSNGIELNNSGWTYLGQLENNFTLGKGWAAELSVNYRSKMALGIYTLYKNFSADIGLQKSIIKNKIKIALSITDLFNTNNQTLVTNFNGIIVKTNLKEESHFVKLQLTYKFGNKNVKPKTNKISSLDDLNKRLGGNK